MFYVVVKTLGVAQGLHRGLFDVCEHFSSSKSCEQTREIYHRTTNVTRDENFPRWYCSRYTLPHSFRDFVH